MRLQLLSIVSSITSPHLTHQGRADPELPVVFIRCNSRDEGVWNTEVEDGSGGGCSDIAPGCTPPLSTSPERPSLPNLSSSCSPLGFIDSAGISLGCDGGFMIYHPAQPNPSLHPRRRIHGPRLK